MRIDLDMCTMQRSFDDQSQPRVRLEAEATRLVVEACVAGHAMLVGSIALEVENDRNPLPLRKAHVAGLLAMATEVVAATPVVERHARGFVQDGIKPMDALHLACAVATDADYFCTCDDRLLRRARALVAGNTKVVSPLELVTELGL